MSAPIVTPDPAARARAWIPVLLVVLTAAAVYANTLAGGFVFDDVSLIKENDAIKSLKYIPEIFSENLWGMLGRASNYYRPLAPLIYMATYLLSGGAPWFFHLVNILFHAGVSALVFLIVRRLLADTDAGGGAGFWTPALLAGLLFATHPIHTEGAAWVSGLMDVSCTFFCLASFYFFLRADRGRVFSAAHGLSWGAFFLAMLCKEPALVLPAGVVVAEWALTGPSARSLRGALKRSIPFFVLLGLHLLLRVYAIHGLTPFEKPEPLGFSKTVLNIAFLFALYLRKLFLPTDLNVLYDLPAVESWLSPIALVSLAATAAFVAGAFLALRRGHRALFLGFAFTALPLAPALYLPGLSQPLQFAFAERYLYFASFGFVLGLACVLGWLARRGRRAYGGAVVVALAATVLFAGLTVRRNTVWRTNLTLWSDAIRKSPEAIPCHKNLGFALYYNGQPEEGRKHFDIALRKQPDIPEGMIFAGLQYISKGMLKNAILEFATALVFDPNSVPAHYNLAVAYQEKGWRDSAVEQYKATLVLEPRHADAHNNLGIVYGEAGRLDDAIGAFEKAVALKPRDASFRQNLARAYEMKQWSDKAAEQRRIAGELLRGR